MSGKTYRIGEAAEMLQLKTYVLRFWETEFPQLEPLRTEKGQRLYTEEHVALLRRIRHLLHERGMTIDGARRVLADDPASPEDAAAVASLDVDRASPELLRELRGELLSLRELLDTPRSGT